MIKSVGDFLNIINELYPEKGDAFFRGQSSSEFDVSSSLCRFISECNSDVKNDVENFSRELFGNFEEHLPAYPESSFLKNYSINKIDMLMTAQHYGMPTRLIDWTINPLISLYFASEGDSNSEYMSVFILKDTEKNPLELFSSMSISRSIECDKKSTHQLYSCIDNTCELINRNIRLGALGNRKINEITLGLISRVEAIPIHTFLEYETRDFLKFHNSDGANTIDMASSLAKNIKDILADCMTSNDYNPLSEILSETNAMLYNNVKNHMGGVAGVKLYGDNHLVVEPLPINSRIKNQQGVFLFSKRCDAPEFEKEYFIHGENSIKSIDDINDSVRNSPIVRIDIRRKISEKIKEELSRYGIRKSFVYPELASFSEEKKIGLLSKLRA